MTSQEFQNELRRRERENKRVKFKFVKQPNGKYYKEFIYFNEPWTPEMIEYFELVQAEFKRLGLNAPYLVTPENTKLQIANCS